MAQLSITRTWVSTGMDPEAEGEEKVTDTMKLPLP